MILILTFDLLTSKSNRFIFVSNDSKTVHLVKFPEAVYVMLTNFLYMNMIFFSHRQLKNSASSSQWMHTSHQEQILSSIDLFLSYWTDYMDARTI